MSEHTPGPFRCQAERCVRRFASRLGMLNVHLGSSDGRHDDNGIQDRIDVQEIQHHG